MAQGSLEVQPTCPKAEGYESTEQSDSEQEKGHSCTFHEASS